MGEGWRTNEVKGLQRKVRIVKLFTVDRQLSVSGSFWMAKKQNGIIYIQVYRGNTSFGHFEGTI